ncbi:c-type cytochrome [Rapidithrix thailandica]|uniref:C-type cytochrome n=1 Tax=Rapidithrix thailandica TaxID=413964 RepID=A0AAW9RTJ9_9BACT
MRNNWIQLAMVGWMAALLYCTPKQNTSTSDDIEQADSLTNSAKKEDMPDLPDSLKVPPAPVLSPQEALASFRLEDGFRVEIVATEPEVSTPVAMTFDAKGRIWVAEMNGYMPNIEGSGEELPTGRIMILEDKDENGHREHSKTFLDNLVLPRALCLVYGGLLYAEPPNLWFVEIQNDQPAHKVLVDSAYAVDGNVEHQPNGLLLARDNWIYSAKSNARYRKIQGKWIKERTTFRGQWGISQDDFGHLFYNTNSSQLRADYILPDGDQRDRKPLLNQALNIDIVGNQHVYPVRMTPGVNRGYLEDFLDEEWKLINFTAACGPVIYRGDNFPEAYYGNAFVAEPSANLIKRNLVCEKEGRLIAKQAYQQREFFASTDERFRPVNLYNAPDGCLYVLDMYRGIIQHKTYMTEFLSKQVKERKLDTPITMGRIYRVVHQDKSPSLIPDLSGATTQQLVNYLSFKNGWIRDKAQQMLIEQNQPGTAEKMETLIQQATSPIGKVHALWVLEGIGKVRLKTIQSAFNEEDISVKATALRVSEVLKGQIAEPTLLTLLQKATKPTENKAVTLQAILSLGKFASPQSVQVLTQLGTSYSSDTLLLGAITSSLATKEAKALALLEKNNQTQHPFYSYLQGYLSTQKNKKNEAILALDETELKQYDTGKKLFTQHCSTCHGEDGAGIEPLAPPLAGSEWVNGDYDPLILITLHGLQGPVTVNGKVYQPPMVQPQMPGLKYNTDFTDEKVAAVLSYIRNTWGNHSSFVEPGRVNQLRNRYKDRKKPFTEKELQALGNQAQ